MPELARLNQLLAEHPCFFDSAKLTRLSPNASPVYALHRVSATGEDSVLVLVNTDVNATKEFFLSETIFKELGEPLIDLLGQAALKPSKSDGRVVFTLSGGAAYCLGSTAKPQGLSGDAYRRARTQASWALSALSKVLMPEFIGNLDWRELARLVEQDPQRFLGAVSNLQSDTSISLNDLRAGGETYSQVVNWTLLDRRRITPVPPAHWLLITDTVPFRAALKVCHEERQRHVESIPVKNGHVAFFPPRNDENAADAELRIERYATDDQQVEASIRFLSEIPAFSPVLSRNEQVPDDAMVLLTNGIGGMSRLCVDLGKIKSKYDCALGASLHPTLPVDRHVLAKRIRVWVNADGFITALNLQNLSSFQAGPPAVWKFVANAGDERTVEIYLHADMLEGRNTTVFKFSLAKGNAVGFSAAEKRKLEVRLTVRVDIEDRNFHSETHRNSGAEHHFGTNCHPLDDKSGFLFAPAHDRTLRAYSSSGFYHHQPEWSENIQHPVEQSRAQVGSGDAYSPGWFDLPLKGSEEVALVLSADANEPSSDLILRADENRIMETTRTLARAKLPEDDSFGRQLALAARQYVVRRGSGKTVIAGYPWFLDWGRDTMIAARGLLSAGMIADVTELLLTFGRFVENGTMPNTIHGENASNRNTSDASLWYGIVAEEAAQMNPGLYSLAVDGRGRTVADVLREIGAGYWRGTPNGIHVDRHSGLVWSPGHFTWMDTNYPAGSPREGYPIEIQALWIRLLRQLDRLHAQPEAERWSDLANRAEKSLHDLYWLEEKGYFSDLLIAKSGVPAKNAVVEDALRSNCLLVISLALATGERARRCVDAAVKYLFVPGALRSLAPLPVSPPLRVEWHGRLLNDPERPYFGQYCGDEDTQRKPAYHNGTAWTWTFPTACEALAIAWEFSPESVAAAKAYLGSMEKLMQNGCLGQLPEILDGDAPHFQRGCDAQAWSVTEALRVWKLLQRIN